MELPLPLAQVHLHYSDDSLKWEDISAATCVCVCVCVCIYMYIFFDSVNNMWLDDQTLF